MYYLNKSITKRLITSREAIEIVQSEPIISDRMSTVGFSSAEMANGQAYQQDAERLHSTQDVEYGNQVAATQTLAGIANRSPSASRSPLSQEIFVGVPTGFGIRYQSLHRHVRTMDDSR